VKAIARVTALALAPLPMENAPVHPTVAQAAAEPLSGVPHIKHAATNL